MANFTVTTTANAGAGSLRQALVDAKLAAGADTIVFDAALNGATITLASELVVDSSVAILGPGAATLTLSGGNATRIFLVQNSASGTPETVTLSGLTLTGGRALNGGAIYSVDEGLTLDRVSITANASTAGYSGGGGIFASLSSGSLSVTNSSFTANTSAGVGGAIVLINGFGAPALIQNVTLANNTATNEGGAINSQGSAMAILNSTIAGNSSGNFGGGVLSFGTVTVRNSILSGNTAPNGPNYSRAGGTVTESYNLIANAAGAGTIGTGTGSIIGAADLGALTLVDGIAVILPNAGSPAINAGDPAFTTPTTDARGFVRVVGARLDMGAVEFGAALPVVGVAAPPADTGSGSSQTPAPPPTVAPTINANFSGVLGKLGFGVNAPPTTVTTPTGQILPNPLLEQQKAIQALIARVDAGQLTLRQAQDIIVDMADATTSVASLSYQFFTGKLPTRARLEHLVSSTANPTDLNDGYYAGMSLENRYINMAVGLSKPPGEGTAFFNANYGPAVTLQAATAKAYLEIFGKAADAAKVAAILTPERSAYFLSLGGDAIGQKAAMVGWLLGEAAKTDTGPYAARNENFLYDLLDGTAAFGADAHVYDNAGPITVGLIGMADSV